VYTNGAASGVLDQLAPRLVDDLTLLGRVLRRRSAEGAAEAAESPAPSFNLHIASQLSHISDLGSEQRKDKLALARLAVELGLVPINNDDKASAVQSALEVLCKNSCNQFSLVSEHMQHLGAATGYPTSTLMNHSCEANTTTSYELASARQIVRFVALCAAAHSSCFNLFPQRCANN
jgi:hypothetical protein